MRASFTAACAIGLAFVPGLSAAQPSSATQALAPEQPKVQALKPVTEGSRRAAQRPQTGRATARPSDPTTSALGPEARLRPDPTKPALDQEANERYRRESEARDRKREQRMLRVMQSICGRC